MLNFHCFYLGFDIEDLNGIDKVTEEGLRKIQSEKEKCDKDQNKSN